MKSKSEAVEYAAEVTIHFFLFPVSILNIVTTLLVHAGFFFFVLGSHLPMSRKLLGDFAAKLLCCFHNPSNS